MKGKEYFEVDLKELKMLLSGDIINVRTKEYLYADGFNKLVKSTAIEVKFIKNLTTRITK